MKACKRWQLAPPNKACRSLFRQVSVVPSCTSIPLKGNPPASELFLSQPLTLCTITCLYIFARCLQRIIYKALIWKIDQIFVFEIKSGEEGRLWMRQTCSYVGKGRLPFLLYEPFPTWECELTWEKWMTGGRRSLNWLLWSSKLLALLPCCRISQASPYELFGGRALPCSFYIRALAGSKTHTNP